MTMRTELVCLACMRTGVILGLSCMRTELA
jgi:hypothetical protein